MFFLNKLVEESSLSQAQKRQKYLFISSVCGIVLNLVISVGKITSGFLLNSLSILNDGINNLSDGASSAVALVAFKMSRKPADEEHPFGHARVEYISGVIVAFLIFVTGFELASSSVQKMMNPEKIEINIYSNIILIFSIAVKFWLYKFNLHISQKTNSETVLGIAKDSRNDIFITLGVLTSITIYYFFDVNIDAFLGFFISIIIMKSAYDLAKDTMSQIIGQAPSEDFVRKLKADLTRADEVSGIHDLNIHSYGHENVYVYVHLEFNENANIIECHRLVRELESEYENKGVRLCIDIDTIVTDEKRTVEFKNKVDEIIFKIDKNLKAHDFRVIDDAGKTYILFDVAIPVQLNIEQAEIMTKIEKEFQDENYVLMVKFDKNTAF